MPCKNYKNHESNKIKYENHKKLKNIRIQSETDENQTNLKISFVKKTILKFLIRTDTCQVTDSTV